MIYLTIFLVVLQSIGCSGIPMRVSFGKFPESESLKESFGLKYENQTLKEKNAWLEGQLVYKDLTPEAKRIVKAFIRAFREISGISMDKEMTSARGAILLEEWEKTDKSKPFHRVFYEDMMKNKAEWPYPKLWERMSQLIEDPAISDYELDFINETRGKPIKNPVEDK